MGVMCAHCGGLIKLEEDTILDAGTTLQCDECNQPTIVDLFKPEERVKFYKRED